MLLRCGNSAIRRSLQVEAALVFPLIQRRVYCKLLRADQMMYWQQVGSRRPRTSSASLVEKRRNTKIAFKSDTAPMPITQEAVLKYVNLCGVQGSVLTKDALSSALQELATADIHVKGDGVIYKGDLHGIAPLADALMQEHACFAHSRYEPNAIGLNDEDKVAFVAVKYEFQNIGNVGDQPPSKGSSQGLLINKLQFSEDGRVKQSLVCRQLTPEERSAKLESPERTCCPADPECMLKGIVAQPVTKEQRDKMQHAIQTWVASWSSDGPKMDTLKDILDENIQEYDAYGLHDHHAKSHTGEKLEPAGPEPREQAAEDIRKMTQDVENRNELVSWAVAEDMLVGFEHWRAHAHMKQTSQPMAVEGVDMLIFSPDCKIKGVLQFTMKPYKALKTA